MRFLYLRDPLFLACVVLYFVNRFVLKSIWRDGFVHDHLNDLLCIPFWLPIMLLAQRHFGLRDDARPRPSELIVPLLLWSFLFEIVLPRTALPGERFVADHQDVLCYSTGALIAGLFWKWWYAGPECRIGLELLARYVVTLDFRNDRMYLKKGKRFAEPEESGWCGIIRWGRIDGKTCIKEIREGGPAAAAGIKAGDEIIGVDGTDASLLSLFEMSSILSTAGRCVRFEVEGPTGRRELELQVAGPRAD